MGGSSSPPMILVLGMTGVGKSTFIQSARPKDRQPTIHHGLASSQAPVEGFEVSNDGQTVLLVDTPGFNDTDKSDRTVLDDIISFLRSRKKQQLVAGIIYLLDTSNREYTPVTADQIEVPPSVVLATVQCHDGPISNQVTTSLREKYGSAYQGHHFGPINQYEAAWGIIGQVLACSETGVSVQAVICSLEGVLQKHAQPSGRRAHMRHALFQKIFRFKAVLRMLCVVAVEDRPEVVQFTKSS